MNNIEIGIKLSNGAKLPEYAHIGDSGFDILTIETFTILAGESFTASTGLYFEIPEGYELQVRSKSGLASKFGIQVLNSPGTVDQNFKGEVKVILHNTSKKNYGFKAGEKVAQGVIAPVYRAEFKTTDSLTTSTRNEEGFGSTGK